MRRAALVLASVLLAVGCSHAAPQPEVKGGAESLIVGGTTANITAFEGMIQSENDEVGAHCGATLISAEWAVSAAHCVIDDLEMGGFQRVVLGRQNTSDNTGESIDVTDVIRHEGYDEETHENDIALLHLAQKSKHKPVRLVTAAEWPKLSATGTQVTVVGWGATREGGAMSNSFRQVTLPIVSTSTCNQQYEGIITQKQVCAAFAKGGKDSCQGDSGGPLFEKVGGVNVQVGIVSFGEGCAEANFAGVYTSVAAFRDWIATNTENAVPAEPPKVEPKPAPDSADDEGSAEDTGSASEATPVGHKPHPTSDSDDDSADADDRESDNEDDTPTSSKSSKTSGAMGEQVGGCQMSHGRGEIGTTGRALLVLAAFVGLLFRRQYQKKQAAEPLSARRVKLKKLRFGRGGIVKHKS